MKQYISITSTPRYGIQVYGFDKLDGSNIRAEWEKKKGLWKFGSRRRLLGSDQDYISDAESIIREKYEEGLNQIFERQRYQRVIAFFEFYGKSSFAGFHVKEPHEVTLIDVNPYKSGITNPDDFEDLYGHLGTAKLIFKGNFNHEVEELIRSGTLPGITFEGVVFKARSQHKQQHPFMFKVKTRQWLDRLKKLCDEDKTLSYNELL